MNLKKINKDLDATFNSEVIRNYIIRDNDQSERDIDYILGWNFPSQGKTNATFSNEQDIMKETAWFKFMKQEPSEFPHILKQNKIDSFNYMNKNTMDNDTLK